MKRQSFRRTIDRLICDQGGGMAVAYGLSLPVILGVASLGTEAGYWYYNAREMQTAADAAAFAAAVEKIKQGSIAIAEDAALQAGALAGDQVTVASPPIQGKMAGNASAVEVVISRQLDPMLARLLIDGPVTITRRAVALARKNNEFCILGLAQVDGAVNIAGTTTINMPNCGLASNSLTSQAILAEGKAKVTASQMYSAGGIDASSNTTLDLEYGVKSNQPVVVDPYHDLAPPATSGCTHDTLYEVVGETVTLSPGEFCAGLRFGAHANVTLMPGIYVISGGDLTIDGQATVSGSGITFFLTGSGSDYANVTIVGGADVDLQAPTSGTYKGVLFYQDRNAPWGDVNYLEGGSTTQLEGAIYFPSQQIHFAGGNSTSSSCTQIIGAQVVVTGNSQIGNDCEEKVEAAGLVRPVLVE